MDDLTNAKWFSILDLFVGYHQVRLKLEDEYKIAFSTHSRHYEFEVMEFGLNRAPNIFQGAMNTILAPLLRKCVIVFFDNIFVHGSSYEDHLAHLQLIFSVLHQEQWHIKLSKCKFVQQQITYFGHILSVDSVSTIPAKVKAIVSWTTPS